MIPGKKLLLAIAFFGLGVGLSALGTSIFKNQKTETRNALTQNIASILQGCEESEAAKTIGCWRRDFRSLLQESGLRQIMEVLEEASYESGIVGGTTNVTCHDIAHVIGEESARVEGSVGKALAQCTRACGFGCFHGVFLGGLKRDDNFLNDLPSLCSAFSDSSFPGQELTACRHGIGHGLADVAGRRLRDALLLCDGFPTEIGREECASGVWMEIVDAPSFGQEKLQLPQDIPDFCKDLPSPYSRVCLRDAASSEYLRSKDAREAFKVCSSYEDSKLAHECAYSLGAMFHFALQGNLDAIYTACQKGRENQIVPCIEGAVFSGLVTDPEGELGIAFCREAENGFRAACFTYLGRSISQLHGVSERVIFCNKLGGVEKSYCLEERN